MLSAFQIDFAAAEFAWALAGGLVLTILMRRSVQRMHRLLRSFSSRPWGPASALALTMFTLQWGIATAFGWPVPALHDEFSYLLAADTFAAGRATNHTHPAWEFLETYHVIWHPTYQSKYPPGSGLVLAIGQVLTGYPIVGIWICLALSTALAFWMLRGWFSIVWAVLGATILICNWPLTMLWGQTFYGGAPALLGGLLVFGAAARLRRGPSLSNAVWLSSGLLVLAVTRPYEGLIASLPVMGLLAFRCWKSTGELRRNWLLRVFLPGLLVVGSGLVVLSWYHWKVTGSPWIWPYRLYEATYTRRTNAINTLLSFTDLGPRGRTIPSLEYESSAATRRIAETRPVLYAIWKVVRQWWFHVGLLATLPFGLAGYTYLRSKLWQPRNSPAASPQSDVSIVNERNCPSRFMWGWSASPPVRIPEGLAWGTVGLVGMAILLQRTAGHSHYAAPIQPLILMLNIQGLRILRTGQLGAYRFGPDFVSWITWSLMLFFALPLCTGANRPGVRLWSIERDRIQKELEQRPRPQLVIVRYGPGHSMHEEWVYNRADIDRARVVWARDLGPERNRNLRRMFPEREVSVVQPDVLPIQVEPVN